MRDGISHMEQKARELHDMCNKTRKARDGFIKDASRDESAAAEQKKQMEDTLADERKKRQEHENEMARLRALLKDLEAKHRALMEKMRLEHKKSMDELERALREELEKLQGQAAAGGLDMDELMAKAIQILEGEPSPYAPSKIATMREQLEALLQKMRDLEAELAALLARRAELEARIADAERRIKEAQDSTPVADECEYGEEALQEWKANKGDYFLWLEQSEADNTNTVEVQTDEVLDPNIRIMDGLEINLRVQAGREVEQQKVRVLNAGDAQLDILELKTDAEWLTAWIEGGLPASIAPGGDLNVNVSFSVHGPPGDHGAHLIVVSNDPDDLPVRDLTT